ncbi:Zinc finger and SCAN domain-containing protein 29 [Chelonia mydas]|uniref:Zinc finger and SCAN domain-containing protein 29 n=1 Tax=Chelonia mydas TaxID=8469 RepID=M7B616_CHEMY|nr:Zinc finger and SCAN domain-containing protein 29 [Chelonia mydas]
MPPRARRAPVWSSGELLDLISVWGEEAVQSQLRSSHRNYDPFGQISRDVMERSHDREALQCRIKVKELQNAYRKVHEANRRSAAAPTTRRFYKELGTILGGDPTSTPGITTDTSEPSATRQEEEEEEQQQSGSEYAEAEEDTPEFLDACIQELFSSQEEGSQLRQPVLREGQTPEDVPSVRFSRSSEDPPNRQQIALQSTPVLYPQEEYGFLCKATCVNETNCSKLTICTQKLRKLIPELQKQADQQKRSNKLLQEKGKVNTFTPSVKMLELIITSPRPITVSSVKLGKTKLDIPDNAKLPPG